MRYADAEGFLLSLPRFTAQGASAYQPGFERMEKLLAAMGHPHRAYPTLHVAGTNGKGSTASMAAAILTASGSRTGLHTSPHLWHLGERMRVDGTAASETWLADAVSRFKPVIEEAAPSFFEATVALSFLFFAEAGVAAAAVEVGLGGRLDATNVLTPRAALVTSISLDHTDLLGGTLGEIAREKAGIFKPGVPALTNAGEPEALAALRETARTVGAPFHDVAHEVRITGAGEAFTFETPLARYPDVHLALPGEHQQRNAALALRGVECFLGHAPEEEPVRRGLGETTRLAGLRARLEVLQASPRIILDVAHNVEGLAAALRFSAPAPGGDLTVLFGLMRDKDAPTMAHLLAESGARVLPIRLEGERALPAADLAALLRDAGADVGEAASVPVMLQRFKEEARAEDTLLITGSHLVAAQVLAATL